MHACLDEFKIIFDEILLYELKSIDDFQNKKNKIV